MRAGLEIEDPLSGHPRYSTQRYLSEGSFGFVVLATENASGKPVSLRIARQSACRYVRKSVSRSLRLQVAIKFLKRLEVTSTAITTIPYIADFLRCCAYPTQYCFFA